MEELSMEVETLAQSFYADTTQTSSPFRQSYQTAQFTQTPNPFHAFPHGHSAFPPVTV